MGAGVRNQGSGRSWKYTFLNLRSFWKRNKMAWKWNDLSRSGESSKKKKQTLQGSKGNWPILANIKLKNEKFPGLSPIPRWGQGLPVRPPPPPPPPAAYGKSITEQKLRVCPAIHFQKVGKYGFQKLQVCPAIHFQKVGKRFFLFHNILKYNFSCRDPFTTPYYKKSTFS